MEDTTASRSFVAESHTGAVRFKLAGEIRDDLRYYHMQGGELPPFQYRIPIDVVGPVTLLITDRLFRAEVIRLGKPVAVASGSIELYRSDVVGRLDERACYRFDGATIAIYVDAPLRRVIFHRTP